MPATNPSAARSYLAESIGIVLIIVIVGWFIVSRYTNPDPSIQTAITLMNEGDLAYRGGNYNDALKLFDEAGELANRVRLEVMSTPEPDPNRPRADASRIEMESQLNGIESDALYRWADCRILQVQFETHAAREKAVVAGETYYLPAEMLSEPEKRLLKSIELYPARSEAYLLLGFIYREQGPDKLAEAIAMLQKAVERNQQSYQAHNALGEAYYANGEQEKAREHFEKAILLNNDYAGAHLNLGMYYANKQDSPTPQADADNAKKCLVTFIELSEKTKTYSKSDLVRARQILKSLSE
ncbi:MAG: tetratricopeptide repeat protein [Planctomycetes bacterium]|nr:tetratricopeptide repeat protein [Planctomycetota bacterium]